MENIIDKQLDLLKICTSCKYKYPISHFISIKQKNNITKQCLKCRKNAVHSQKKYHKKLFKIIEETKAAYPCFKCGDDIDTHKQFHHIDSSKKINDIKSLRKLNDIKKEIDKCIILCRKCHCKETFNHNYKTIKLQKKYEIICQYKINIGKCQNNCNDIFDPDVLSFYEFDHIDPKTKKYNISDMVYKNFKELYIELKKCQLLCSYCHYDKTITTIKKYPELDFYEGISSKHGRKYISNKPNQKILFSDIEIILQLAKDGVSQTNIASKYNISRQHISKLLRDNGIKKIKNIIQIKGTEIINTFRSLKDAQKHTKINRKFISKICNNKVFSPYEFTFKFEE